jgi:ankyrin repeat protein
MIAAASNQADLANLLIKSGADAALQDESGRTALAIARDKGNEAVIKVLEQSAPNTAANSG